MSDACQTCRYWKIQVSGGAYGECRRSPPVIVEAEWLANPEDEERDWLASRWPVTDEGDWCGEFGGKP
jgi:hypothetical protein